MKERYHKAINKNSGYFLPDSMLYWVTGNVKGLHEIIIATKLTGYKYFIS